MHGVTQDTLLDVGMTIVTLLTGRPKEAQCCKCNCRERVPVAQDNVIDDTNSTRRGQFEDVVVPDGPCIARSLEPPLRMPFDVELVRSGQHWRTLGITVSYDESHCLVIDEIRGPSLMTDWNHTHDISLQVRAGDTIISVNDSSGNEDIMMSKLRALGKDSVVRLSLVPGAPHFDEVTFTPIAATESKRGRQHPELRKHFKTLDLSEDADPETIRRHYRHLARIHHPDKNLENQVAAAKRFQEISSAYAAIQVRLNL